MHGLYLERLLIIFENAISTYFKLDKSPNDNFAIHSSLLLTFTLLTYYFIKIYISKKIKNKYKKKPMSITLITEK